MGLFMAISGVANTRSSVVEEALRNYASSRGGELKPVAPPADPSDALLIAESGDHVTVVYPDDFMGWDEAAQHLSEVLNTSVFSFHIHDGDLWMYVLFADGTQVDQFNPIPDYWGDLSDEELEDGEGSQQWAGNASVVSQHWPGVLPEAIERYLAAWDLLEKEPTKAYEDDRFCFNDCWQLTDFMNRLGLVYPIDDQGRVSASCYRFVVKRR